MNASWPTLRIGALRRLPVGTPGKARLARALLRGIRFSENVTVESSSGSQFVVPHLGEPVGFHMLVDGRYEPETEDFILKHLCAGDVFVDAGANIGVFTVGAARKVGARGRVLAVEPSPVVFPYLERNLAMNSLENVAACRVALSNENRDDVPFYAPPANHFGMGALTPQFHVEPDMVATRTLDGLLADHQLHSVALLKVDVEGYELGVFQGAQNLLSGPNSPTIVFEFCDWAEQRFVNAHLGQAQDFLITLGYRIWRLEEHRAGGRPLRFPLRSGSAMLVAQRV